MKKYYLIPLLLLFSIILFGCETDGSNDSPVITGNDAVSYVVNSLEPDWTTLVSVEDAEDGAIDIDLSMIDLTNVNMNSTGYFTVVYSVNDSDGNISHFMITVEITSGNVQNDQPIIYGPAQLEFFLNSAEPDWASFLTASDNEDGNIQITSSMIDASAVDMSTLGTYVVIYTVPDSEGASTGYILTVEIIVDPDIVEPTLVFNGDAVMLHEAGTSFADPGAVATDNYGDIAIVTVSGNINADTVGSYTLTYTSTFNNDSITRTINVVDTTAPEFEVRAQYYTVCPLEESTTPSDGLLYEGSVISGGLLDVPTPCDHAVTPDWTRYIFNVYDISIATLTFETISSDVNLREVGQYEVTVKVSDEYGNNEIKQFPVIVSYPTTETIFESFQVSPGVIGFTLQNIENTENINVKYTIEYYDTVGAQWVAVNGHQNIVDFTPQIDFNVSELDSDKLYRMIVTHQDATTNEIEYSYSPPISLLNMFLTSSLVIDFTSVNLNLLLSETNVGLLDSVTIRKSSEVTIITTLALDQLSDVSYDGYEPNTDYVLTVTFDNGYEFEFYFSTEEDLVPENNFPLTEQDMMDIKTYINTMITDHFNTFITDETFCLDHYYSDSVSDISSPVSSQERCTTYRSSTLALGGVYTLDNIEYVNYGYSEDGTQEYIFALTIYYNGGAGIGQFGYRLYHVNIVKDDTAFYGFKEMDFFPAYTMLYVSPEDLDDYVDTWATIATSGIDINTYCDDRSYIGAFPDCITTMNQIDGNALVGHSYVLTRKEGFYSVVIITLNLLNATTNEQFTIELPLAISQVQNEETFAYELIDALYYQKNITYAEIETIKQEFITYLEDYWDQTLSHEDFLLLYSDEYLDIDVYRVLDWSNNIDATFIDIVYDRYQPGFGPSFKVYYTNDGITKETIIGYRTLDNTIRQATYLIKLMPE